ncbi:MAG TPA: YkgJ family cysteine cluster protein [Vicinamibacteria bacterium]|nr:YkgJ family cysteine cluster protein [Vicinamibacteria bacterium]
MCDSLVLAAVKRVALWRFQADLAVHRAVRWARGERPWRLGGDCRRCASCCEAPAIAVGALTWSWWPVRRLFLWWQRRVNGFLPVRAEEEGWTFVFRCTHFDHATRSCDSYASRPGMCRDYPRLLLWQANPELLPRCGYRASPPNAEGLRAALSRLPLTPEQREKLRRGLRLDG